MQVDIMRGLEALRVLQADWRRIYAADPEGQFFLSWPWMSKRLERRRGWALLVARPAPNAPPVGLFPVKRRTRTNRKGRSYAEIMMPGRGAADYTGFLCEPEHQDWVARAFAARLRRLDWQVMNLECLRLSKRRSKGFLGAFGANRFAVERESMVMDSGIDNAICPYADLADDWDRYLAELSANTRQRLRRLLRRVDGTTIRVTHADADTVQRDIGILLQLWTERWAEDKGERLQSILDSTREELTDAQANGTLHLPILWRGAQPVAALASLIDFEKRQMLFQLGARDPSADELSPGLLLHAHSIRSAIERGLLRYDFLRGNERYKYTFATGERRIESIIIRRARIA